MSALAVLVGADECTFALDGARHVVPLGVATLIRTELTGDPPSPEELTNAIGAVLDHPAHLVELRLERRLAGREGSGDRSHLDAAVA